MQRRPIRSAQKAPKARGIAGEEFPLTLIGGEMKMVPALIQVPKRAIVNGACDVTLVVSDGTRDVHRQAYRVMGPGGSHAVDGAAKKEGEP
jgi:hypothetical protein